MEHSMKVYRVFGTAAALLAAIAAGPAGAADPGITADTVTIGLWSPLTGPTALLGTSERDAIEIAIGEVNAAGGVNGRKIRLITYDDSGSPQEALASVRRLIDQDQVFALIAGSTSGSTLPVVPLITRAKIPFIASISSNRKLLDPFNKYIFRVYANENAQAERVIEFALRQGVKTPAIIYTSNDYGIGGEEAVTHRFKEAGISLVARERYNQADQDFSAQLLRIKQSGADSLFIWAFAAEAGIIVRQAKELGLEIPLFGGGGTATPLFPKAAGASGQGFVASYVVGDLPDHSDKSSIVAYRDALTKRYSGALPPGRPSEYDLAGYGALKILAEGLRRAGKEPTRDGLVTALETLKDFDPGTIFPVTFTAANHEGTNQTAILRIDKSLTWEIVR
jgi:branched-chain amino acid transport system substrate-binding protein